MVANQQASPALVQSVSPAPRRARTVVRSGRKLIGLRDPVCVSDFRARAKRRLPRAIFDFVDGAAGHEVTARDNEAAFARYVFRPEVLTDVSSCSTTARVLGTPVDVPILFGPSGMQRIVTRHGELAAARAAARAGSIYVLSAAASTTLEDVAAGAPGGRKWFQAFLWNSHDWVTKLLARADEAGYEALCITVDTKTPGGRKYRDMRNGMSDPRIDLRAAFDGVRHPRWLGGFVGGGRIRSAHLLDDVNNRGVSLFRSPGFLQRRMDPSATWDEIAWLRRAWAGPLVIKGIMTPEDAQRSIDAGVDGIICSNHGGRVLDGAPATLDALPPIVERARKAGKEVYIDGGIRTGGDVVKAIALGATATLIARPFWWGLAVDGEDGAARVVELLKDEMISTMVQIGRQTVGDIDRATVAAAAGARI